MIVIFHCNQVNEVAYRGVPLVMRVQYL